MWEALEASNYGRRRAHGGKIWKHIAVLTWIYKGSEKAGISGCSERWGKDTTDTDYPEGSVPHSSSHMSFSVLFAKGFLLNCQNLGRIQFLPVHPTAGLIGKSSSSEFPVNAKSSLCGWAWRDGTVPVVVQRSCLALAPPLPHKHLFGLRLINIS